jgi:hypothetical protein
MRVPHPSKLTHSICSKSKPDISWIIREVLLMSKIKLFPLPSTGCRIFPSVLRFTCQSNNSASLGFENICFKRSITSRYHITRAGTFLSLEPSMSRSGVTFFLFRPCLFLLLLLESSSTSSLLSFHLYRLALNLGDLCLISCSFRYKMQWFGQA